MTYRLTIPLDAAGASLTIVADTAVDLSAELAMIDVATLGQLIPTGLGQPQPPARPAPAATPTPTPAQQGPTCPHGPRTYRTGVSAKGPWAAWMCPAPKGTPGQCEPMWIDQAAPAPQPTYAPAPF